MPNELAPHTASWNTSQTRAQFLAIAWLRWRIVVNSFRRKGGAGELIARILIYPILGALALLPTAGVGAAAFLFAQSGRLDRTAWLLWGTFILCQLLNIQLGQPGSTFDPTQLIRFPLSAPGYIAIRLFFGLLTPANVIGTMMCVAIAIGIGVAVPALWLYAFVALAVFAATNVLFSRMIFAWVDRWLATRRAREIFTGLVFAISLSIQWLQFKFNPVYNGHKHGDPTAKISMTLKLYHRGQPFLQALPPELTTRAILAGHLRMPSSFAGLTLGCAAFAAVFLAVFALRMKTEFRGENLTDAANGVAPKKVPAKMAVGSNSRFPAGMTERKDTAETESGQTVVAKQGSDSLGPSAPIAAMLAKEFLYIRRNMGLLYSVVAPLVFVFLFAGRLATRGSVQWVFPAAVAYTLLGISPLSYNSFGLEGAGSQFYFFAPVRLRDVLLAKNLMNFGVALLEAAVVFCIVTYVAGMPPLSTVAVALFWAAGTLLLTTVLGNRRSISAPKQINLARAAGKQASPLSALIGMGILLASGSVAGAIFLAAMYFKLMWPLLPVFAAFFAVSIWVYLRGLNAIDAFAQKHREEMFAELCKKV